MKLDNISSIILVTGYLGLLNGIRRFLLPIALISYGWDLQSYGTIYFIQALMMSLPMILGGYSTDFSGRKITIIFSVVLFTIGVFMFSWVIASTSLLTLIVAQVITTISSGITRMGLSIQIADETEEGEHRTKSLGSQAGLRSFLSFVGPLAFGFILEVQDLNIFGLKSFQMGFFILGCLGIIGIFVTTMLPQLSAEQLEENRQTRVWDMNDDQKSMQYAFGVQEIIIGFTSGMIVPYIDFYILTTFDPSSSIWGIIVSFGNIGVASGSFIASRYAENIGKAKTILIFNGLVPLLASGIAFAPSLGLVSVFYIGRITTANLIHPIWQSWYYSHLNKNTRGRLMSILRLSRRLTRAVGTASGPFVYSSLGAMMFPAGAIFYPLAMAIPTIIEKKISES